MSESSRKHVGKAKKRLLSHEKQLIEKGELEECTHPGAQSCFYRAESTHLDYDNTDLTVVYRPMGDAEVLHLVHENQLPDTQPYQAIMEGEAGRAYAEKYLYGVKRVDTHPTPVVEFVTPKVLIAELFAKQHKIEDGVISTGLGSKGGKGLSKFNESLENGKTTWRIVLLKRSS